MLCESAILCFCAFVRYISLRNFSTVNKPQIVIHVTLHVTVYVPILSRNQENLANVARPPPVWVGSGDEINAQHEMLL